MRELFGEKGTRIAGIQVLERERGLFGERIKILGFRVRK